MMVKYAELGTRWSVMDVRKLEFQDASIDVAIDKGTLDAFLHGSLWDPPEDVRENVGAYVDQVCNFLFWVFLFFLSLVGSRGARVEMGLMSRMDC